MGLVPRPLGRIEKIPVIPRCSAAGSFIGLLKWDQHSLFNFVVIQNYILYSVQRNTKFLNDYRFQGNKNRILNFKPATHIPKSKVLYLTKEYEDCFYKLLSPNRIKPDSSRVNSPPALSNEIMTRLKYLRLFIPIFQGHWGDYWHLETQPEVEIVVLNRTLDTAKIYYRFGYGGGEAILIKEHTKWFIAKCNESWIE